MKGIKFKLDYLCGCIGKVFFRNEKRSSDMIGKKLSNGGLFLLAVSSHKNGINA